MRWHRFLTVAVVVFIAACSLLERGPPPSPAAPVEPALVGGEWTAFAVDGVDEITAPKPKLIWTSADRVVGSGGCNGFSGRATRQGSSLRFTALAPSERTCLSLPGGQEDKFFKALEHTRQLRFDVGFQLVLLDDKGSVVARFTRPD